MSCLDDGAWAVYTFSATGFASFSIGARGGVEPEEGEAKLEA